MTTQPDGKAVVLGNKHTHMLLVGMKKKHNPMKDDLVISYHSYRRIYPFPRQSHFWEFTRQIRLEYLRNAVCISLFVAAIYNK